MTELWGGLTEWGQGGSRRNRGRSQRGGIKAYDGGSRRNRGRRQRGGYDGGYDEPGVDSTKGMTGGRTRRNRGRSQRGGYIKFVTGDGGSRRNRGRSQRGGIVGYQTF